MMQVYYKLLSTLRLFISFLYNVVFIYCGIVAVGILSAPLAFARSTTKITISLNKSGLGYDILYVTTAQADIDNSGTIDYGEFVAAMLHLNKIEKEDHLYAAFSYFDKDGSGYITQDELQQACEQFGLEAIHLEDVIREVDQDNDGRIDYSEFVAMMQDRDFGKKGYKIT
ncbi:Calcium-dependent protein kinase 20 [Vitis vinifera]|uniref:Calcium-dependent protein kinase 20 n=1 Tax=Vitis vinifera TaxID=29760 RepID=A0A438HZ88_VITVI|nr:Calcium-dependent protein kinase 20 [Vitis vinifera]